MKKLNFGCGSIQPKGWDNLDSNPEFGAIFQDIRLISPKTYDIIVAHCSIQMIEWHSLVNELEELYRVLKPGGILRISLPDIVAGFGAFIEGNKAWFPNGEPDLDERFSAWLTWYSTTKTLLTSGALAQMLSKVGFLYDNIQRVSYKSTRFGALNQVTEELISLDTRDGECFFIEAKK